MLSKKKVIKELNEEIIELKTKNNDLECFVNLLNRQKSDLKKHQVPKIKKIVCNEKKKATTVFFADKGVVVVKCAKGVKYDKYTAVAYAIVEKIFENNSKFKRVVDKLEEK